MNLKNPMIGRETVRAERGEDSEAIIGGKRRTDFQLEPRLLSPLPQARCS